MKNVGGAVGVVLFVILGPDPGIQPARPGTETEKCFCFFLDSRLRGNDGMKERE